MKSIAVIIEKGTRGGYGASVPKFPGCISIGNTLEEVKKNIQDAIHLHLETLAEFDELGADVVINNLQFEYHFDLPTFSQVFSWIKISALAKAAGMNQSLVRQYTSGKKYPSEKQAGILQEAIRRLSEDLGNVQLI